MPGDTDRQYVLARRAMLDGIAALAPHLDSIVVIGAQAVYLHTGPADLAVAEFTTDADLAIGPEFLAHEPQIDALLEERGFRLQKDPGMWKTVDGIQVDLLVPEALAGPGRRGARLPGHGKRAGRRVKGIEGVFIDNTIQKITALEPADTRSFQVAVAGPAALVVAKIHKISERVHQPDRLVEKDALDLLRLLRTTSTGDLVDALSELSADPLASAVTEQAVELAESLFGEPTAPGAQMAARAATGLENATVIAESIAALTRDVLTTRDRAG